MIKMKRTIAAIVAVAGLVFAASAANAASTLGLTWRGQASDDLDIGVDVNTSDLVIADIIITADTVGIGGIFWSVAYDATELSVVGAVENNPVGLPGMGNSFTPLGIAPIDDGLGLITRFEQTIPGGQPGLFAANGTKTLGSVRFHVLSGANGSGDRDVAVGFFLPGIDSANDPLGNQVSVNFAPDLAITGPVPEPTTAALVLAGLIGLGYAGRRSLR